MHKLRRAMESHAARLTTEMTVSVRSTNTRHDPRLFRQHATRQLQMRGWLDVGDLLLKDLHAAILHLLAR